MTLVSVIIPVHNSEKYVEESIESILNQSYKKLEIIVVNDGSKDDSARIIKQFKDKRIIFIDKRINSGIAAALNVGIRRSKGDFIIRMDADDVSTFDRIDKQVDFMRSHSKIGVSGSSMLDYGNKQITIKALAGIDIGYKLMYKNILFHPTTIIRKSLLVENKLDYDVTFRNAQDYKLWTELAKISDIGNLEDPLVLYRSHDNQQTVTNRTHQLKNHVVIQEQFIEYAESSKNFKKRYIIKAKLIYLRNIIFFKFQIKFRFRNR